MDFDVVLHAIECVITFGILGGVGYVLAKAGWFTNESQILLSRLVTTVALPPYLFYNILSSFTRDQLLHLLYGCLVPLASVIICFFTSIAIARVLKVPRTRRGIFYASFAFSNTIYIGLPVNLALFGEAAIPYALLFYFGYTTFFWTVGNYRMSLDGEGCEVKLLSRKTLTNIFSPPLCGFLLGMVMLTLNLKLPTFLAATAKSLGGLATPLILLSVGATLYSMGIRNIKFSRELAAILFGRFIFAPLVIIAITAFVPLPTLMRQVFIIQSSLPAMSTLSLLATYYKTDSEYAAVGLSATTLCSMVTIPLYMLIVTHL